MMESNPEPTGTKTRGMVLLRAGEVVEPGTLLRMGGDGTFVKVEDQSLKYDPLKFMAWSREAIDLRGKQSQPIWAEVNESD